MGLHERSKVLVAVLKIHQPWPFPVLLFCFLFIQTVNSFPLSYVPITKMFCWGNWVQVVIETFWTLQVNINLFSFKETFIFILCLCLFASMNVYVCVWCVYVSVVCVYVCVVYVCLYMCVIMVCLYVFMWCVCVCDLCGICVFGVCVWSVCISGVCNICVWCWKSQKTASVLLTLRV